MRRLICIPMFLAFATFQTFAQQARTIEDTIAGITVGKSTFEDIQRKFSARLILVDGRHAVRWDDECEIFFDFGLDDSDRPTNRVENIQLLNLGRGAQKQSPCHEITTGRGLRLSDSPQRVQTLYGPAKHFLRDEMTVIAYDSKPRCPRGSKTAILMHDMGTEWLRGAVGLHNIYLGITSSTCDELNSD
jgi:hypothetical protein